MWTSIFLNCFTSLFHIDHNSSNIQKKKILQMDFNCLLLPAYFYTKLANIVFILLQLKAHNRQYGFWAYRNVEVYHVAFYSNIHNT